jgi:hypothetical protein
MIGYASSAYGRMPLDETISQFKPAPKKHLMITIGSTPVSDPYGLIRTVEYLGGTVSAHHNAPIGQNEIIYADQTDKMIHQLTELGITRYSRHGPSLEQFRDWNVTTFDEAISWAIRTWERYNEAGIQFSLETMYPIKHRGSEKECWLAYPNSVINFVRAAKEVGWDRPISADVSHMHIAEWTIDHVARLRDMNCIAEVHYSANDGKHDQHRPMGTAEPETSYYNALNRGFGFRFSPDVLWIDEGRIKHKPMQRRTP